jgi:hypothetical protein
VYIVKENDEERRTTKGMSKAKGGRIPENILSWK